MTFKHWVKSRLLPANTFRGGLARRFYYLLTPGKAHPQALYMLQALAKSNIDVAFVQVGSNDAGYGDPLAYHTRHHGWRGLMIEPLPHIYARLRKRYDRIKGLKFANVAIDREAGERTFYHLRRSEEPGLPPWYDMLGSFNRDNVLKHQKYLADIPERIVETKVRCQTFDGLCTEFGIARFDMLHIDAEGYDYEVLKTVDLRRYQPALVLFEHAHLSAADYQASLEKLHAAGYLTHRDPEDLLAVRASALHEHAPMMRAWHRLRRRSGVAGEAAHSGETRGGSNG